MQLLVLVVCRAEPHKLQKMRLHGAAVHTAIQELNMLMNTSQRKHSCKSQHIQLLNADACDARAMPAATQAHPRHND